MDIRENNHTLYYTKTEEYNAVQIELDLFFFFFLFDY